MLVTEALPNKHPNRRGAGAKSLPLLPASARVLEIELSQPLPIITAFDNTTQVHYKRVFCLFRLHTQPLGILQFQFPSDQLSPQDYAPSIWRAFKNTLLSHLEQDGLPPIHEIDVQGLPYQNLPHCMAERERFLTHAPFVSVIIPTRDRPASLAKCIDALLKLHYPDYEILIVDNCPTTPETANLVKNTYQHVPNLRYIREDNPGISHARNRGMHEARGEILAFTDDDVIVDTYWLAQSAQAFAQSNDIACVTGHTLPLELNTPAQLWFEDISWIENGDINNKFSPRIFDKKTRHIQLYRGNLCGHGANMAAKADFLRSIGGFDTILGTGTPTMGGEDLAFFLHVIMHNKKLAYEPTALVHHLHRRDYDKLRQQVFGYGTGFTAYLLHMLLCYPILWVDLLTKTAYDILSTLLTPKAQTPSTTGKQKNPAKLKSARKSTNYPRELVAIQVKGLLYGPVAYVKSRGRALR
jgi:glycosyltransferase involved in cell wall biosynthesis